MFASLSPLPSSVSRNASAPNELSKCDAVKQQKPLIMVSASTGSIAPLPSARESEPEAVGCWTKFTRRIRRAFTRDRQTYKPIKVAKRALDTDPSYTGHALKFDWNRFAFGQRGDKVSKIGGGGNGYVISGVLLGDDAPVGDQDKQLSPHYVLKKGVAIDLETAMESLERVGEFGYAPDGYEDLVVMQHKGVSLVSLMTANPLPSAVAGCMMRPVLEQIAALHQKKLLHGDVKPDNIVVDRTGNTALVDFDDVSHPIYTDNGKDIYRQECVTFLYSGPEAYVREDPAFWRNPVRISCPAFVSNKVDIWGFGHSLACMVLGANPNFLDESNYFEPRFDEDAYNLFTTYLKKQTTISQEVKDVILACMALDPDKRPSAEELLNSFALFQDKDPSLMGAMELTITHHKQFECLKAAELALEKAVNSQVQPSEIRLLKANLSRVQATVLKLQSLLEMQQKSSIPGARMDYARPGDDGDQGTPASPLVSSGYIASRPNLIRSDVVASGFGNSPLAAQGGVGSSSSLKSENTKL